MLKENRELDEYYYHEAIDRSFIIANMIEDLLISHPVFQKHDELNTNANAALDKINDLYLIIGKLSVELFPDPLDKPEKE